MKLLRFLAPVALAALCLSAAPRPIHIFLAGDSTMANKTMHRSVFDSATMQRVNVPFPERGWGMMLQDFFREGQVQVVNYARNGRSTRSFMNEGRWQTILEQIEPGDYVVIQFGHNDQPKGKGSRYSSPEDYGINLERMIATAREKGATPILCTPTARRNFNDDGSYRSSHGVYPDVMKKVAAEQNVPLIDMHQMSADFIVREGPQASMKYYMQLPAGTNKNYPRGLSDNTHFRAEGAIQMAQFFVDGLHQQHIDPLLDRLNKAYDYRQ